MPPSPIAIEARWQRIDGHPQAFWLLCEGERVLAELHALARGPAGWGAPPRPVPPAALRLVHLVHAGAGFDATVPGLPAPQPRDYDASEIALRHDGDTAALRAGWERAACALPLLNRALEDAGPGAPAVDSHSALRTLAAWMGLQAPPPWAGRPADAADALPAIRGPSPDPALDPAPVSTAPVAVGAPVDPLYRQARNAVARMEDGIGRDYDATSERLARALAELAREHGLAGIDHVVLGRGRGRVRAGENVFIVRGRLDDPAHQRVAMRTDEALRDRG